MTVLKILHVYTHTCVLTYTHIHKHTLIYTKNINID